MTYNQDNIGISCVKLAKRFIWHPNWFHCLKAQKSQRKYLIHQQKNLFNKQLQEI